MILLRYAFGREDYRWLKASGALKFKNGKHCVTGNSGAGFQSGKNEIIRRADRKWDSYRDSESGKRTWVGDLGEAGGDGERMDSLYIS
jgi:hypothetical protein